MFKCPHCGFKFQEDALYCPNCKSQLSFTRPKSDDVKTLSISDEIKIDINVDTNAILNREGMILFVGDEQVSLPIGERAYIGRDGGLELETDSNAIYINLSQVGGQLFGVSRLHVRLDVSESRRYSIMDLSSTNGTRQNDKRLKSFQSYPVNDNDIISIGKFLVEVRLSFDKTKPMARNPESNAI